MLAFLREYDQATYSLTLAPRNDWGTIEKIVEEQRLIALEAFSEMFD